MSWQERAFAGAPLALRYAAVGAVLAFVPGAAIGLALGIVAHPSTAWFAAFEVGLPCGFVGFVAGLLVGATDERRARLRARRR